MLLAASGPEGNVVTGSSKWVARFWVVGRDGVSGAGSIGGAGGGFCE